MWERAGIIVIVVLEIIPSHKNVSCKQTHSWKHIAHYMRNISRRNRITTFLIKAFILREKQRKYLMEICIIKDKIE